jgi:hydrogenase maturation protease
VNRIDDARKVADAVLYEGYLLYPYRASATKNQQRWQFGVLVPPSYAATGTGEYTTMRTECLLEVGSAAVLHARLRFLQLATRRATADHGSGGAVGAGDGWDEAVEREVDVVAPVAELAGEGLLTPFTVPAGTDRDGGQTRQRQQLSGALRLRTEQVPGPYPLLRLLAEVANTSGWSVARPTRTQALRHSLVATHFLLAVDDGRFMSLLDPPEWAQSAAQQCRNLRTWPVLVGDPERRDLLLSSPIILYDYPQVAPESPGETFDCTEIDELLSLRTLTLTDSEKAQVRATDPRAAELLDRVEQLPPELLARLHGAIRAVSPARPESLDYPDRIEVAGQWLGPGSRVRLHPGGRDGRATDAQDMFLAGRTATVRQVRTDVEGRRYLAVTLDDDAGADLHASHGRFRYFDPDEVEPLPPGDWATAPDVVAAPAGETAAGRVLVAGVGNIFLGDDGFGVELAHRLAETELPPGVRVADYGISGMRLAYELLEGGYELTILLDAAARGEAAGTVSVIEVAAGDVGWVGDDDLAAAGRFVDAHGMQPEQVLALVRTLGGEPGRVLVVGCEPADTGPGIGLSEPVAAAVRQAVPLVRRLLDEPPVPGRAGQQAEPPVTAAVGEESAR